MRSEGWEIYDMRTARKSLNSSTVIGWLCCLILGFLIGGVMSLTIKQIVRTQENIKAISGSVTIQEQARNLPE